MKITLNADGALLERGMQDNDRHTTKPIDAVIACSARRMTADALTRDHPFHRGEGIRVLDTLED